MMALVSILVKLLFFQFLLGSAGYSHAFFACAEAFAQKCTLFPCFVQMWRVNFELIRKVKVEHLVLKELRAGSGFKRCAIVDIGPTGSYQTTLKRIGLGCIGF